MMKMKYSQFYGILESLINEILEGYDDCEICILTFVSEKFKILINYNKDKNELDFDFPIYLYLDGIVTLYQRSLNELKTELRKAIIKTML